MGFMEFVLIYGIQSIFIIFLQIAYALGKDLWYTNGTISWSLVENDAPISHSHKKPASIGINIDAAPAVRRTSLSFYNFTQFFGAHAHQGLLFFPLYGFVNVTHFSACWRDEKGKSPLLTNSKTFPRSINFGVYEAGFVTLLVYAVKGCPFAFYGRSRILSLFFSARCVNERKRLENINSFHLLYAVASNLFLVFDGAPFHL